jgi:hypothetical protein
MEKGKCPISTLKTCPIQKAFDNFLTIMASVKGREKVR